MWGSGGREKYQPKMVSPRRRPESWNPGALGRSVCFFNCIERKGAGGMRHTQSSTCIIDFQQKDQPGALLPRNRQRFGERERER